MNADFLACPDCGKPVGEDHRHDPDCVHLDINFWIERTTRAESALGKIVRFAPGNGEECEVIARIARNALEGVEGDDYLKRAHMAEFECDRLTKQNAALVAALREIAARADFRYHDPCERSPRDVQEWEREIRDYARAAARAALARATEGE